MEIKEENEDVKIKEIFRLKNDTDEKTAEIEASSTKKPRVYIIGDSHILHGAGRALETLGTSLGLCAQVRWFGRGGLVWRNLLSWFNQCLGRGPAPDVLLIHCGGNDLGQVRSLDLVSDMKRDLQALHTKFPQMKIFFSAITMRSQWRCLRPHKMEKVRKFINSVMGSFVQSIGGGVVHHPQINHKVCGVFLIDGVRLSLLGNDMFLKNIAQCLKNQIQ